MRTLQFQLGIQSVNYEYQDLPRGRVYEEIEDFSIENFISTTSSL